MNDRVFDVKKSESSLFASCSQIDDTNNYNMSPEPRSVESSSTTCRKRGVSTSSTSDLEEYMHTSGGSHSSKRRNNSSSQTIRIFSPSQGQQLPFAPCLDRNKKNDATNLTASFGYCHQDMKIPPNRINQKDENHNRTKNDHRGNINDMDQDTSYENESDHQQSPDSSFEVIDSGKTFHTNEQDVSLFVEDDDEAKIKRILDTMPSSEDLTFVIEGLKREERREHHLFVGVGDMWRITPLMSWTSQRRATFLTWTKKSLGLTLGSMGAGVMFVQIRKKRGLQLVELLERARSKLASSDQPKPVSSILVDSERLFTSHLSIETPPNVEGHLTSITHPPLSSLYVVSFACLPTFVT
jgi:hypothetical protein